MSSTGTGAQSGLERICLSRLFPSSAHPIQLHARFHKGEIVYVVARDPDISWTRAAGETAEEFDDMVIARYWSCAGFRPGAPATRARSRRAHMPASERKFPRGGGLRAEAAILLGLLATSHDFEACFDGDLPCHASVLVSSWHRTTGKRPTNYQLAANAAASTRGLHATIRGLLRGVRRGFSRPRATLAA
jgi:hypothetical protein